MRPGRTNSAWVHAGRGPMFERTTVVLRNAGLDS